MAPNYQADTIRRATILKACAVARALGDAGQVAQAQNAMLNRTARATLCGKLNARVWPGCECAGCGEPSVGTWCTECKRNGGPS